MSSAVVEFFDSAGIVVAFVELGLTHWTFRSGGGWSRFISPCCGRTARVLRLHNNAPICTTCLETVHKIWPRSSTQTPYQRALCSVARLTKMLNEPQTLRAHTWGTMEKRSRYEAALVEAQLRVALYQRRLRKKVAQELEPRRNRGASRDRTALPYIPPRPPELDHLTDEAASAALASHYGNFTLAARELGVDAKLLRRLFWHNPRIMDTSKERTELFHSMVIDELVVQLNSRSYGKYLRAAAELADYPTIRPAPGLGKLLTRDIKPGKPRGRHARKPAPVNVDAVVEREVERKVELRASGSARSVDASARVLERVAAAGSATAIGSVA